MVSVDSLILDSLVLAACLGFCLVLVPVFQRQWAAVTVAISDRFDREHIRIETRRISRWLALSCVLVAVLLFALLRSVWASAIGVLVVWLIPGWTLSVLQYRRRILFNRQFVDVLLLMANSLRAGFNLSQSIEIVGNEMPAPASEEFRLMKRERDLGASMEESLHSLGRRMHSDSMTIFVTAVMVTLSTGGDIARVLDKLVRTIRDRERCEDRIRTMTAEGRGQGYIIASLPVLILAARYLVNPEGVIRLFHTPWGLAIVVVGVTLNLIGLFVLQKCAQVKV